MAEPKICGGGKRYCVVCPHYAGKVLEDGTKIKLHSIPKMPPQEKTDARSQLKREQRRGWIARIKLARPNAPITLGTRICNLHFTGHHYSGSLHEVPTHINLTKPKQQSVPRRPLVRLQPPVEETPVCAFNDMDTDDQVCLPVASAASQQEETAHPRSISVGVQCELIGAPVKTCDIGVEAKLPNLTVEDIQGNDAKTRFYTGFKNWGTFWGIFQILLTKHGASCLKLWDGEKRSMDEPANRKYQQNSTTSKPGKQRFLRPEDEYFLVWLRLRHDIRQEMLADMFCVSVKTVSRILNTWINFLYDHFKGLIPWPTREQILANLPHHFSESSNVRIVLDATEMFCEKPSSLTSQYLTWSDYKSHNTMKLVIGVAPNGLVTFVSRLWGGKASDRLIVHKDGEGFIPLLESGDVVMADKGFTIADLLPKDVGLNMPPFISKSKQMTAAEFFTTQQIACPRIVVEMKMEQWKNYRIMQGVMEMSEAHLAEQVAVICLASTNLLNPLL